MKPVIISVAPNGARKTKQDHPNIPITPQELAREAKDCLAAGASLFHLHIRNDDQSHSLDANRYKAAISAIKETVGDGLILQVSTECCGIYLPQDQINLVKATCPESASIGVRELVPNVSAKEAAKAFLAWSQEKHILIQYILYSAEDVIYFSELCKEGIIPKQACYFLLFVLGKKSGQVSTASPSELAPFLEAKNQLNDTVEWAVCAFGNQELDCMLEAVKHGGHVRIGFENNDKLKNGTTAQNNAELISQFRAALPHTDFSKTQQTRNLFSTIQISSAS